MKRGPKTEPGLGDVRRCTLTLDATTWAMLEALGGGNVSRGVRIAARGEYRRYQQAPGPANIIRGSSTAQLAAGLRLPLPGAPSEPDVPRG